MKNILQSFRNDESGAVTVDWVVLTAAVVGLGIAVVSTVGEGATNLSEQIQQQLESSNSGSGF